MGLPPKYLLAVGGCSGEQGNACELFVCGKDGRDEGPLAVTDDDDPFRVDLRSGSESGERRPRIVDVVLEAGGEVVPFALADASLVVAE